MVIQLNLKMVRNKKRSKTRIKRRKTTRIINQRMAKKIRRREQLLMMYRT